METIPDTRCYRLSPEAHPTEERRVLRGYVTALLLTCSAGVLASVVLVRWHGGGVGLSATFALLYIGVGSVWMIRRAKRSLRECWDTYEIEIGPDYIIRRQGRLTDLRLTAAEIRRIEHLHGRYLRVVGNQSGCIIAIPESVDSFSEVLDGISRFGPIGEVRVEFWKKQIGLVAAGFAAYLAMLWSNSPWIVIPVGLGVSCLLVFAFLHTRRSANMPAGRRWMAWLYLLFVLVCGLKVFVVLVNTFASPKP